MALVRCTCIGDFASAADGIRWVPAVLDADCEYVWHRLEAEPLPLDA